MKKLILLTSLAALFVLMAVPALAQEATVSTPESATDQYDVSGKGGDIQSASEEAIEDLVRQGEDADGAEAYKAALNAAREAGADQETAEVVAAEAVAEVSEPEITELPDTGGTSVLTLGAGILVAGAGLLVRRLF